MGLLAVLVMAGLTVSPVLAAPCESLASLKLPNATITSANTVAAGAFTLPTAGGSATTASRFSTLPAFCRVAATLTPSSDSDIKIEV
jgi:feruloyl esterase